MLLNGDEIRSRQLVLDEDPGSYRAATYDLTIGTIMYMAPKTTAGEKYPQEMELCESTEGVEVEPQGMVKVVSKEVLRLPPNVVGFALVKNAQSNNGLLALNIGVIDPGYEGPIASTLINFSPRQQRLGRGEPFLRISFYEVEEPKSSARPPQYRREDYLERTRHDVVKHSSPTFLNLDRFVDKASKAAFGEFRSFLNLWVPVVALVAVFITIFVPVVVEAVYRYMPKSSFEDQVSRQVQFHIETDLTPELEDLRRRLSALEAESSAAAAVSDQESETRGQNQ